MARSRVEQYDKKRKKNKLLTIAVGLVIAVLAVGGVLIATHQTSLNQSNENTSIKSVNSLTMKDVSALVTVYAHQHYPKNKDWKAVYQAADTDSVRVEKYKIYQFDDYEARAVKNHPLYVMKKRAIFAMSTTKPKATSQITIGDSHKQLTTKSLSEIYQDVIGNKAAKQEYVLILDNISVDKNVSVSVVDR